MKFTDLPDKPGVYLFMDRSYNVVYIGKAKSLKKRVMSHFSGKDLSLKHMAMLSQVRTVDYITTKNEKEALILEDQLIKNLKPRYNVALRDDKSYPYLEVTKGEEYPFLRITRKTDNPDSLYFGPFPNVRDIRTAKKVVDKIFPLRKCKKFNKKERPCLNYQIGRCLSPCTDKTDKKTYHEIVEELVMFLSGKHERLIQRLENRMNSHKEKREYEQAANIRDQIEELKNIFPMVNIRKISRKKVETLKKIDPLFTLKEVLDMEHKPTVIEGFDISHTSSKEAAGSMVYFRESEPDKSRYRKFKIKQQETSDDLKMLKEVIYRRIKRLIHEDRSLPDILVIDGGKAQEKVAREVAESFNLKNVRVISIAKKKGNIYYKGKKLKLDKNSSAFKLIKRINNESHRFAHSYHELRRKKNFNQ